MTSLIERLVPEELWVLFRRVVPEKAVLRPQGGGRRRAGDREVLAAVVFVATTRCTWRQLPPVFGPAWLAARAAVIQSAYYLPEPCLFSPEQVTEYPHPRELDKELRDQLDDFSRWETIDPARHNTYAYDPGELYLGNLSTAPGWKTGGWTRWDPTDPVDRPCPECGTEEVPLLTIASSEWDGISKSWIPEEEPTNPAPPPLGAQDGNFTLIDIVGGYNLQLHACPADPSHPHIELVQ
jgi:transposase